MDARTPPWPGPAGIALLMLLLVLPPLAILASSLIPPSHPAEQFAVAYLAAFGFAAGFAWWRARSDDPTAWSGALRVPPASFFAVLPFVLIGFWLCLLGSLAALSSWIPVSRSLLEQGRHLAERPFVAVAVVVVAAPVLEEFVFRGAVFRGLVARMPVAPAIAISAVLFAAIHGNPHQFLTALAIGGIAGWLRWRTGGLVAPIVWHAAHNGAMLLAADGVARLAGVPPDAMERATLPMPPVSRLMFGVLLSAVAWGMWGRTLPSRRPPGPTD